MARPQPLREILGPIWAIPIASILMEEAPKLRVMLVGLISTVEPCPRSA